MSTPKTNSPTNLVIFGATGDLSIKKLFPSLLQLFLENALPAQTQVYAVSRRQTDKVEDFIAKIIPYCESRCEYSSEEFDRFAQRISMAYADIADTDSFTHLKPLVGEGTQVIYYFSVSPTLYPDLTAGLKAFDLINERTRVVIEKPLGHDLESAQAIDGQLRTCFKEEQLFRIDHYLGKETVQNIMALRFGNSILEPLWSKRHVDHIEITVAEKIGVANRGPFYDETGALRDMIQNHLLQILCVTAMEPPEQLTAEQIRQQKLKVLRALRPITPEQVLEKTAKGQYVASSKRSDAQDYTQESGVASDSNTETFVALKVEIDNERWSGVPIYLRTGKHLAAKSAEIVVYFKTNNSPFAEQSSDHSDTTNNLYRNRLVISIQPEETVKLYMNVKQAGLGMNLQTVALNLDLTHTSQGRRWQAYERLLLDVIEGDLTLFMREEDVMAAWRWIDPIIEGWQTHCPKPQPYEAGSWGPVSADQLLARDGNVWHNAIDQQ